MKIEQVSLPQHSILTGIEYDYADSFKSEVIDSDNKLTPTVAAKALFSSSPQWIGHLLNIRNRLVSVFGLKTGGKHFDLGTLMDNFKGEEGDHLALFKVYNTTDNELIMGENDRHLDFRVSLLLDRIDDLRQNLTISTTVVYNNWFGRIYFFFIKPFHKLIVPTMLKGIVREVEKGKVG